MPDRRSSAIASCWKRADKRVSGRCGLRQDADQARPHFRNAVDYFEELRRRGVQQRRCCIAIWATPICSPTICRMPFCRIIAVCVCRRTIVALRESLAEARESVVYPPSGDLGRPRSDGAAAVAAVPARGLAGDPAIPVTCWDASA